MFFGIFYIDWYFFVSLPSHHYCITVHCKWHLDPASSWIITIQVHVTVDMYTMYRHLISRIYMTSWIACTYTCIIDIFCIRLIKCSFKSWFGVTLTHNMTSRLYIHQRCFYGHRHVFRLISHCRQESHLGIQSFYCDVCDLLHNVASWDEEFQSIHIL